MFIALAPPLMMKETMGEGGGWRCVNRIQSVFQSKFQSLLCKRYCIN